MRNTTVGALGMLGLLLGQASGFDAPLREPLMSAQLTDLPGELPPVRGTAPPTDEETPQQPPPAAVEPEPGAAPQVGPSEGTEPEEGAPIEQAAPPALGEEEPPAVPTDEEALMGPEVILPEPVTEPVVTGPATEEPPTSEPAPPEAPALGVAPPSLALLVTQGYYASTYGNLPPGEIAGPKPGTVEGPAAGSVSGVRPLGEPPSAAQSTTAVPPYVGYAASSEDLLAAAIIGRSAPIAAGRAFVLPAGALRPPTPPPISNGFGAIPEPSLTGGIPPAANVAAPGTTIPPSVYPPPGPVLPSLGTVPPLPSVPVLGTPVPPTLP